MIWRWSQLHYPSAARWVLQQRGGRPAVCGEPGAFLPVECRIRRLAILGQFTVVDQVRLRRGNGIPLLVLRSASAGLAGRRGALQIRGESRATTVCRLGGHQRGEELLRRRRGDDGGSEAAGGGAQQAKQDERQGAARVESAGGVAPELTTVVSTAVERPAGWPSCRRCTRGTATRGGGGRRRAWTEATGQRLRDTGGVRASVGWRDGRRE